MSDRIDSYMYFIILRFSIVALLKRQLEEADNNKRRKKTAVLVLLSLDVMM